MSVPWLRPTLAEGALCITSRKLYLCITSRQLYNLLSEGLVGNKCVKKRIVVKILRICYFVVLGIFGANLATSRVRYPYDRYNKQYDRQDEENIDGIVTMMSIVYFKR